MLDQKQQLRITLTEPVIFLRSSDPTGRRDPDPNDPPTLVRGILTLEVVKPIGVSSIEVELTGLLTVKRREEVSENHQIYSSTVSVFRADQVPHGKRSASLGPGSSAPIPNNHHVMTTLAARPPSLPRGRTEHTLTVTPDLGPTPPYTPVAHLPQTLIPTQPRVEVRSESPAQTLEELRQTLRGNLEGHPYGDVLCEQLLPPSPHLHSNTSSLTNSATHSNVSISSNELHQEDDNAIHSSPTSTDDSPFHNSTEEPLCMPPHRGPSPSYPSRSCSPENAHTSQSHTRRNAHDSLNTPTRSRLRLSFGHVLDAVMEVTSRAPSRPRDVVSSEETERGRTRVRIITGEQGREHVQGDEGVAGEDTGRLAFHPSAHTEHREHHLIGLGRILGLHRDHEKGKDVQQKSKDHGGWREFQPGTYSYPISFLLPPNLPPTFSVPRGSLNYIIRGVAHRPGTFTSKFSCEVPLLVVAAPTIGTGDASGPGDPGPLFFERQWEGQLAYSLGLSSRLFLLGSQRHLAAATGQGIRANIDPLVGIDAEARAEAAYGTAILDLNLLPLEKIKVWKLSVIIDERVGCVDDRRKLLLDETIGRVKLLEVQDACSAEEISSPVDEEEQTRKDKHKHDSIQIPLLPTPISPHRSPLLRHMPPSTDPSILAGPGPYTLSLTIGLPDCNDPSGSALHFTVKQKSSRVMVTHCLRLVVRVERVRGDDDTNDHEGIKKRLFDITVQVPVSILSCRCVPEHQTLPRYSPATEDWSPNRSACPCLNGITERTEYGTDHDQAHVVASNRSSFEGDDAVGYLHHQAGEQRSVHNRSRSPSHARRNDRPSPFATPLHPHSPLPVSQTHEMGSHVHPPQTQHPHHHHHHPHSHTHSVSMTSNVRAHLQTTPVSTPHSSRPPSPLARYERLVSGLESEAGEAPPSYESISSCF